MDATEISGQIKDLIAVGEWGEAARVLALEWNAVSEFGVYHCDLPNQTDATVIFKTSGYPFKLRRLWDEAKNDAEVLALILPHVDSWSMRGASGSPLATPQDCLRDSALLDDLEEALLMWLVRSFWNFWRVQLMTPRKN